MHFITSMNLDSELGGEGEDQKSEQNQSEEAKKVKNKHMKRSIDSLITEVSKGMHLI